MTGLPRRLAAFIVTCLTASPIAHADDVLIFAAASTAVALEKAIHKYDQVSDDRVRASYASSGTLARQLYNGAPAALYLSANTKWMDWVEKNSLLAPETRIPLLRNRLVLVRSGGAAVQLIERDLRGWLEEAQRHRTAIADPAHAPAGDYARQALTSLGLWKSISHRAIRAQNVRAALLLVEKKEVTYGIIYRTDAHSSKHVQTLAAFPEDTHKPILYGLALIKGKDGPAARRFYDYLKSAAGKLNFRRFGFLTP